MEARENLDLIRRRLEGTGGRIAVAPKTLPPDVLRRIGEVLHLGPDPLR